MAMASNISLVMLSFSQSTDCNIVATTFRRKDFLQVQNSCVPDEDLCGRIFVLLQSNVLHAMLSSTTDIIIYMYQFVVVSTTMKHCYRMVISNS